MERSTDNRKVKGSTPFRPIDHYVIIFNRLDFPLLLYDEEEMFSVTASITSMLLGILIVANDDDGC